MSKIKVIHFADFHLGVDTHGPLDPETRLNGRILDFLDSLDALIDYAIDKDADIVLFAGDAFHKHSPDPTLLREFGERIIRLSEYCPVILLVGNHDIPGSIEKASAVDVFATLRVPNVIVGWDYEIHKVITKKGLIQIITVPYPLKNQFLEMNEKRSMKLLKERLTETIESLAAEVDKDYPAILLAHLSVNTAIYGSERLMYIGEGAELDIQTLVQDAWQYVALGHIHYHQDLSKIVKDLPIPIVYAGSLDRVDFSEEKDVKGFVWLEIDCDGASWEFVEIDARPFITLVVDVTESKSPTAKVISKIEKKDLTDAVVRLKIIIQENRETAISKERIIKALQEADVYWIHSIAFDIQREILSRFEEPTDLVSMSDTEKLSVYFDLIEVRNKKSLMSLAKEIMSEVDNDYH